MPYEHTATAIRLMEFEHLVHRQSYMLEGGASEPLIRGERVFAAVTPRADLSKKGWACKAGWRIIRPTHVLKLRRIAIRKVDT